MKRSKLGTVVFLLSLLILFPCLGRAADVDVILRDVSGGQAVGKADIAGQHFELKVARLASATEFIVEVLGSFTQGSVVVGRFLTGARGGAMFRIEVTSVDLSLVEEIKVRFPDGGAGTVVMRGLVR